MARSGNRKTLGQADRHGAVARHPDRQRQSIMPVLVAGLALGLAVGAMAIRAPLDLQGLVFAPDDFPDAPAVMTVSLVDGSVLNVGQSEVTIREWAVCVTDEACMAPWHAAPPAPDLPVTGVNWLDVQDYLAWLSQKTGHVWRLPSRDEWLRFAAEAAPVPKAPLFKDPRLAWAADYDLTATPRSTIPRPIGSFGANSLGLVDLKGNVWEWTSTCWSDSAGASQHCRGVRIAMGEHDAVLSELTRDPSKAGCGGGIPPSAVGFRVIDTGRK